MSRALQWGVVELGTSSEQKSIIAVFCVPHQGVIDEPREFRPSMMGVLQGIEAVHVFDARSEANCKAL